MSEGAPIKTRLSRREWILILLLVISALINYIDRTNLGLAAGPVQEEFALSATQWGSLLAAFSWTYAFLQLLGISGWLSDRFSVGWVMVGGFVLWSGATMATGVVASFSALFVMRLVLGAGESVAYPCYSRMFAALPQEHRGRANALIDVGTKLGPALGAYAGGIFLANYGWRMMFFVVGTGGLLWLVPWVMSMPRLERNAEGKDGTTRSSIKKLLVQKAAWGAFLGHFCGNYLFYFLLTWLPTYLTGEEKMDTQSMSHLASVIFLLIGTTTMITGWTTDRLIAGGASPTRVRRAAVIGGLGVASVLLLLTFVHHNFPLSIAVICVAGVGYGAFASNHWAIAQTLAGPSMAGRWSSLQNGVANLSGIVAPWVSGWIVQSTGSSRMAFVLAGAVCLAGACCWGLLVRRIEPVQWDAAT